MDSTAETLQGKTWEHYSQRTRPLPFTNHALIPEGHKLADHALQGLYAELNRAEVLSDGAA